MVDSVLIKEDGIESSHIVVDGTRENVDTVTDFIRDQLSGKIVDRKVVAQINVAIDEIYSNISQYAYGGSVGKIKIEVKCINNSILELSFVDSGKPFNPLEKEDPDISLDIDERGIGGLGIFIVKKTMDNVDYKYENGHNILTLTKKLD